MENLISEELKRIKKLFGDELLYGNLNNLNEQAGRYFKKVWDDFKVKNPNVAKNFNEINVKKFTDTDIKSLDDVFKHLSENANIWKAIGLTDQDITISSLIQKQITSKNNPAFLFQESSVPGKYFFDFIPVEGGLRGEVFYWYSKKYPNAWVEGLRSLPSEQKSKTTGLKDLGGTEISTNVDLPTLPKVRVDKNGYPIDFKDGKPVDKLGNEVKLLDDGKPDTALATIESTDTSTLTPIRVDENGLPIDFDANDRPLDIDGDFINVGDDGRPTDPDRPRVDDEYNPRDKDGNPLDEAGKIKDGNAEKYGKLELLWEACKNNWPGSTLFYERVYAFFKGKKFEDFIVERFNRTLEALIDQQIKGIDVGLDDVRLRRKFINDFLELQKITAKDLDGLVLQQIKDEVADVVLMGLTGEPRRFKAEQLNSLWKSLQEGDNGLENLFKLISEDRNIPSDVLAFFTRVKREWNDFWYKDELLAAYEKKGIDSKSITFQKYMTKVMHNIEALAARSWQITLKQQPYTREEFARIMSRYKLNPNAIIYRQIIHMVFKRVIRPAIWGLSVYLFWADGKAFGGFRRTIEGNTEYELSQEDETSIMKEYIIPEIQKGSFVYPEDESTLGVIFNAMIGLTPTNTDEDIKLAIEWMDKGQKSQKEKKKTIEIKGVDNLKIKKELIQADSDRVDSIYEVIDNVELLDTQISMRIEAGENISKDVLEAAKKLEKIVYVPQDENDQINTKEKLEKWNGSERFLMSRAKFVVNGKEYFLNNVQSKELLVVTNKENTEQTPIVSFLDTYKDQILAEPDRAKEMESRETLKQKTTKKLQDLDSEIKNMSGPRNESIRRLLKKLIMEDTGKKFGEDNFKHWKDTFTFKSGDDKNPGQYKEVKINMEDVMDRIDHYRKKYDEDDAFVRAVIDTHEDVVKIMYTKGLADIHESATPRGLALVLRTLNESRGEMEIFSVARPANGNWFLVKGDYTQSQLANMDLEKKEPEDKEKKKDISGSEELKKKEEKAIRVLKSNEKEGLDDLPKKVRQKLLEKMGKGWTPETPPSFLEKLVEKSQINTIFNDKIDIFKLDSNDDTFDAIVDNSSQIFIKRGFCRSLYIANDNANLDEKQEKVVNHILEKCDRKFGGKLGVRNF